MLKLNLIFFLYFTFMSWQVNASDISPDPRIINGTAAQLDAVKHQASIRAREVDEQEFGKGHKCGGSLISDNVVLTAAHCVPASSPRNKEFVVVLGALNRFEKTNNTLVYDISKVIRGNFTATLDSDIALLILNGTVPANHTTVQPISLNDGPLKNNTLCQVTGWGVTEENDLSTYLRTVDVPLIDFNDCREKTFYKTAVRKGMMCAGYLEGGRDSCTSDSGGPLVCKGIQAGIVSWGMECGKPLKPGVYTDVAYYKDWITEHLTNNNVSMPQFAQVPDGAAALSFCSIIACISLIVNFIR